MSPKIRETLYYLGTIIPALLGIGLIWGGIDEGAADSIGDIIAGVIALAGASAPATAAAKVHQQRKDGTFDSLAPVDQIARSVEQVVAAKHAAEAEFDRVQQVIGAAVSQVPVLGPLASQILTLDDSLLRRH